MNLTIPKASTSVSIYVYAQEADFTPTTSIAHTEITATYVRARGTLSSITLSALAAVDTAYTSGGWKEISAVACPGIYRLDLPDAVCATGVEMATVRIFDVTLSYPFVIEPVFIQLQTVPDITVLGNAALNASKDITQDVEIWEGANAPTLAWTITDSTGAAVNVSAYTLKLIVYNYDGTTKFTLTSAGGGGLVVSGSGNNIITATYTTTHSSYLDTLRYELWRADGGTSGDQVLAAGAWVVQPTQKWTA